MSELDGLEVELAAALDAEGYGREDVAEIKATLEKRKEDMRGFVEAGRDQKPMGKRCQEEIERLERIVALDTKIDTLNGQQDVAQDTHAAGGLVELEAELAAALDAEGYEREDIAEIKATLEKRKEDMRGLVEAGRDQKPMGKRCQEEIERLERIMALDAEICELSNAVGGDGAAERAALEADRAKKEEEETR